MRRLFIVFLLFMGISLGSMAQTDSVMNIRSMFISMPDTLLPTLSRNNRLDLVDFYESGMKAEVKNCFDGQTELLLLTADSLSLRVSNALTVDLLLLPISGVPIDSCQYVVGMVERFGTQADALETRVSFYSVQWRPLDDVPIPASSMQRLKGFEMSTILKWKVDTVNK